MENPDIATTAESPSSLGSALKGSNIFFCDLADTDWERWRYRLQLIHLKAGDILVREGLKQTYVYFPVSCIIAVSLRQESGDRIDIAHIGRDSALGLISHTHRPQESARILCAGSAYRVPKEWITAETETSGAFRKLIFEFINHQLQKGMVSLYCSRHHTIEQQVCTFILSMFDLIAGETIYLTQEKIASTLGVRRESVNSIAKSLKNNKVIQYSRGLLRINNRPLLASLACTCHTKAYNLS